LSGAEVEVDLEVEVGGGCLAMAAAEGEGVVWWGRGAMPRLVSCGASSEW